LYVKLNPMTTTATAIDRAAIGHAHDREDR